MIGNELVMPLLLRRDEEMKGNIGRRALLVRAAPLFDPATVEPGFPSREELRERYAERSGRDLSEIDFFVALGYWKLAIILEGVYARYAAAYVTELATVRALLNRAKALDEKWESGAIHEALIAFDGLPPLLGGSPAAARSSQVRHASASSVAPAPISRISTI